MATKVHNVSAKRDHIENQTKAKTPILAVAELIWNALDADATSVEVSLERNKLDEIEEIVITDNQGILNQIRSYATTVAKDDRFKAANVRWSFWVVANDLTPDAEEECNQANRDPGIAYQSKDGMVIVWAKRWSQVIQDAEAKLRFFRERLDYAATQESGLKHLQKTYDKYLPSPMKKAASGGVE